MNGLPLATGSDLNGTALITEGFKSIMHIRRRLAALSGTKHSCHDASIAAHHIGRPFMFCIAIVFIFAHALSAEQSSANPPGLTVVDGNFFKEGREFRGVGINFYNAFLRKLGLEGAEPDLSDTSYRQRFEILRSYEIPFIRFAACGFYPVEWDVYLNDKEGYFEAFDKFVAYAEETGMGLIPTLFWTYFTLPDVVGEPLDQWGNPDSKTHAMMRQYTREVVERYVDSPAIWAWEFGNEYLLEADIPDPNAGRGWIIPDYDYGTPDFRTERDKMYRRNVWVAYEAFVETVRSIDDSRPIFSGDSKPRKSAYHNWSENTWKTDSKEEWKRIFIKDNRHMNALSAHFYYYSPDPEAEDSDLMYLNPSDQIEFMMQIAEKENKPLWIGEFGVDGTDKTIEEERKQFEFLINLMLEHEVHLSALWNFDFGHEDQTQWNITPDNHRSYMLEALRDANRKIREAGYSCNKH